MLFLLLCLIFFSFCSDWDFDTVITCCTSLLTILPLMSVLNTHRCKCGIWYDYHTSERFSAKKPVSTDHFLNKKMPAESQEYDSYPFVWYVCAFDFCNAIRTYILIFTMRVGWKQNFTTKEMISGSKWCSWNHHLVNWTDAMTGCLPVVEYLCQRWYRICSLGRRNYHPVRFLPNRVRLFTGFVITRGTRQVTHVDQDLLYLPGPRDHPQLLRGFVLRLYPYLWQFYLLCLFVLLYIYISM